jgi:CheY-like chemotaxis protein
VVDERVPEVIRGDSVRLAQILYNLVGNAIKFTAKGQVTVITTVTAEQENCVELLFTVTDTGIGIPEEKQQQIFEAFTQASSSTTRVYGGAGLGLAITKMLVELQGGTISLKSRVNEGSTFSVRLKFGKGSKNAGPKQPTREDSFNVFKGVRVLLVEDDAINQKIISKLLSSWGACLETASNGKIAVRMIRENKYQLVLMDLQMPEMDGFHTTMKIRNLKGNYFQELPILALTSSAFEEDLERICSSGMNGYVIKPFRPVDLNHKIFRMLDKRSLTLS